MSFNNQFDDEGYPEFLQSLLDNCHLDPVAQGIARQVIAEGLTSLSAKQKITLERHVGDFVISSCTRGSCDIPWSGMYEANINGGMCSWCAQLGDEEY